MTVNDYLSGPEDLSRRELIWGVVREPPAPAVSHQQVVVRVTVLLDTHVRRRDLGLVLVAPTDVVLDGDRALVVQPDVLFISRARESIIRERIWGAPDLVVEVASGSSRAYDFSTKVEWYARYGVRECWLVEFAPHQVTVVSFDEHGGRAAHTARGRDRIRSAVLPTFTGTVESLFE